MPATTSALPPNQWPVWFNGKSINEAIFCRQFLISQPLVYTDGAFFTVEGRMTDESVLQGQIYGMLQCCASTSVTKKIGNIIDLLKITARVDELVPQDDRIHVVNGTLMLDGDFLPYKNQIVRSRFPIHYNPQAGPPERWLRFLGEVLYPEDIPTLQEFIGYCLIPSNKGQRMMIIKGNGGEGKSQIGTVVSRMFGCNAKDGSVGKVSENRFARADLEHIHLMIDDDMRMEALKQTNYVKSLVTAQGKMDLEKKKTPSWKWNWNPRARKALKSGCVKLRFMRNTRKQRRCWIGFQGRCWRNTAIGKLHTRRGITMNRLDDAAKQAAFERCMDFLARMIEKYGAELDMPDNCAEIKDNGDVEASPLFHIFIIVWDIRVAICFSIIFLFHLDTAISIR